MADHEQKSGRGRHSGRAQADDALVAALAVGMSVRSAAKHCMVSEKTVYRRLSDARFKKKLAVAKAEFFQRAVDVLAASCTEAAMTLRALHQDKTVPPAVRHAAARTVIELTYRLRETADLEALKDRLEMLETQRDCHA